MAEKLLEGVGEHFSNQIDKFLKLKGSSHKRELENLSQ